jgi:hypothetical protein
MNSGMDSGMDQPRRNEPGAAAGDPPEPASLRFLRRLVTLLTIVLIGGIVVVAAVLVIRLAAPVAPALPGLPAAIALPAGETALAVTVGAGFVLVLTRDGAGHERARLIDAATGAERAVMDIAPR